MIGAWNNSPELKAQYVRKAEMHRIADLLVRGIYWKQGKGCGIGCLTHDEQGGHEELSELIGVPVELLYLMDWVFEQIELEDAKLYPEKFLKAIAPGTDLRRIYPELLRIELVRTSDRMGECPKVRELLLAAEHYIAQPWLVTGVVPKTVHPKVLALRAEVNNAYSELLFPSTNAFDMVNYIMQLVDRGGYSYFAGPVLQHGFRVQRYDPDPSTYIDETPLWVHLGTTLLTMLKAAPPCTTT